ncbi:zinc-ribbon domain-containing protein [bacterium]|nr:zinc-ribbon domain-containing protein [bacterium]
MAKKKLKDLPRSSSRVKTIGQDPLMKVFRGIPLRRSHPALACEYEDLGPYSADDVSAGSNRVVRWRHGRCGEFIEVAINIRARAWDEGTKDQGCYICAGRDPRPKPPQVIPKWLQKEIVRDRRRATRVKDISPWSQSYWLFKCPSGGELVYSSRIMDRLNPISQEPKQGCPCRKCCKDKRVNLMAESVERKRGRPDVWNMFLRTRENVGFDPKRLPVNHRVRWKCAKNAGHRFARSLAELYKDGCPTCAKEDDENSLAALKYRHIAREFLFVPSDPELSPINIKPGSHVVAAFRCSEGHTFNKAVCRRTQPNPENCPYCAGKRSDAPTLLSVSPYILKRWHPEKNVAIDSKSGEEKPIDPELILADSRKKYWFYCFYEHIYQASPAELLAGVDQCRSCALLPDNVDNAREGLAEQWFQERNGDRTPWNTAAGCRSKVWWKCQAGPDHEWMAEVYQRAIKGTDCPFCANRQVSVTNSLRTIHPELAKLMHADDNAGRTASDVVATTTKAIKWRCPCSKTYERSVQHMLERGTGCSACRKIEALAIKQKAKDYC